MIEKITNFLNKFTSTQPIFTIMNEIEKNRHLCAVETKQSSDSWLQFIFTFTQPLSLTFTLHKPTSTTTLSYSNVLELNVVVYQNVFLDCSVVMDNANEQFYVLNDVYKMEFELKNKAGVDLNGIS